MSIPLTSLLIGLLGFALIAFVGLRDHRWLRASRRSLLEACRAAIDDGEITLGGDAFPKLTGRSKGRAVHAVLIPDTMTIRRLPQLWLSVTVLDRLPVAPGFAVLVRPSGNDFYSLTEGFHESLTPPSGLPWEVQIRGEGAAAQSLLDALGPAIGAILADPRVKEVAVTQRGVRIVRQAAEGRRGEHLLLRQAIFDDAEVDPEMFRLVLGQLAQLTQLAKQQNRAVAA